MPLTKVQTADRRQSKIVQSSIVHPQSPIANRQSPISTCNCQSPISISNLQSSVCSPVIQSCSMTGAAAIELCGVHISRGAAGLVLRGLDLAIGEGETVALVGRSGAGK